MLILYLSLREGQTYNVVIIAKRIHLFPFRTQKLSPSTPMVLGWRRPGRVGRCRIPLPRLCKQAGLFVYLSANRPQARAQKRKCLVTIEMGQKSPAPFKRLGKAKANYLCRFKHNFNEGSAVRRIENMERIAFCDNGGVRIFSFCRFKRQGR